MQRGSVFYYVREAYLKERHKVGWRTCSSAGPYKKAFEYLLDIQVKAVETDAIPRFQALAQMDGTDIYPDAIPLLKLNGIDLLDPLHICWKEHVAVAAKSCDRDTYDLEGNMIQPRKPNPRFGTPKSCPSWFSFSDSDYRKNALHICCPFGCSSLRTNVVISIRCVVLPICRVGHAVSSGPALPDGPPHERVRQQISPPL